LPGREKIFLIKEFVKERTKEILSVNKHVII